MENVVVINRSVAYLTKKQLEDKNMRKSVPAFDPVAIAEMCGFHTKVVRM